MFLGFIKSDGFISSRKWVPDRLAAWHPAMTPGGRPQRPWRWPPAGGHPGPSPRSSFLLVARGAVIQAVNAPAWLSFEMADLIWKVYNQDFENVF